MSLQKKIKSVHFVGIGGAGMSGLADILINLGHKVSGSDREQSETTEYLAKRGAQIYKGHTSQNIQTADILVYTSAVTADNPEIVQAKKEKIPCIRRANLLGQLMRKKTGIGVAGTHGKTTTTSIIGKLLIDAGLDPTIVVGGKMQDTQTNARLGEGQLFVTEADEYDRSFLELFPQISVITSLEEDHLDIYAGLTDLCRTFTEFANHTAFDGLVILCADDKNLLKLNDDINTNVITYGVSQEAAIRAENTVLTDGRSSFDVFFGNKKQGTFKLNVPGLHNIKNALAAIAVGMELEIPVATMVESLAGFSGVQRRFEFKGKVGDILFYDDYAHHPTEVEAALQAAKSSWKRRVVVAFQPHLFSRTNDFYIEFARTLSLADKVLLCEIYPAREKPQAGITSELIANELKTDYTYFRNNDDISNGIGVELKKGDLFLTMGAGDIWKYGEQALTEMQNRS